MKRWVRKDERFRILTHESVTSKTDICLACGSSQKSCNGSNNGCCGICMIGYLKGWTNSEAICGYAHCSQKAIARKGYKPVCATHIKVAVHGLIATTHGDPGVTPQQAWLQRKRLTVAEFVSYCTGQREREWEEVES